MNLHVARGFCRPHYWEYRTHGGGIIQPHSSPGVGSVDERGYRRNGHKREHVLLAEKALGKKLPSGVVTHHFDGDKSNNSCNLVICQNQAYHFLLHSRQTAAEACGNPNWIKCRYCKVWDDPITGNMLVSPGSNHHRKCRNQVERNARKVKAA